MRVVFTGPAEIAGQRVARKYLMEIAEKQGLEVQSMVTRDTDVVVASSPEFKGRKGRKLAKADELGVRCMSPEQFLKMLKVKVVVLS